MRANSFLTAYTSASCMKASSDLRSGLSQRKAFSLLAGHTLSVLSLSMAFS